MPTTPLPRQRRKEARPGEIVAAALELFLTKGFAATKIDDVARAAGVTKGTVYLYYPSKEALFQAAVRETVIPNIARSDEAIATAGQSAAEQLRTIMHLWAASIGECRGSLLKLLISEAGNFPELADFYIEEVVKPVQGFIAGIIHHGIERGEFRPVDAEMLARVLFAPIALTNIWRYTHSGPNALPSDLVALAGFHLDVVLNGITLSRMPT